MVMANLLMEILFVAKIIKEVVMGVDAQIPPLLVLITWALRTLVAKFVSKLATQLQNIDTDLIKTSNLPQHLKPMLPLLHHIMIRCGN